MKSFPRFKAVVATLEQEQDLRGLTGLLGLVLVIDQVNTAFMNKPRFKARICDGFFEGESDRLAKRINVLVAAIERSPITDEGDRDHVLHSLMQHAAHVGGGADEVADIVEAVKRKPIVPKQEAA